jgi:hypothetical protein
MKNTSKIAAAALVAALAVPQKTEAFGPAFALMVPAFPILMAGTLTYFSTGGFETTNTGKEVIDCTNDIIEEYKAKYTAEVGNKKFRVNDTTIKRSAIKEDSLRIAKMYENQK